MSCESSNWGSRIHSPLSELCLLEFEERKRIDKSEFIKEGENDSKKI